VNIAPGWGPAYSVARAPIHVVRSLKKLWSRAKKHGLALPCYGPRIRFMMVEKAAKPQIETVKLSRHLDGRGMANSRLFHARTAWLRYVDLPMVLCLLYSRGSGVGRKCG